MGKTQILVDAPRRDDFPDFICDCETHSNKWVEEVEVKALGENHFIVNLKQKTAKSLPTINPKDLEDIKKSSETAATDRK